jgi:hypothetical protein
MQTDELMEWMAYASLEPFGSLRSDLQAGVIASTIVNVLGGKAKPGDFVLTTQPKKEKTAKEMEAFFTSLAAQMGGNVR